MDDKIKSGSAQWLALMKSLDFFEPFGDKELDELLKFCSAKKYSSGEYILREANEGYTFYLLLQGEAQIIKKDAMGLKHEIARLKKGDCFGEMAMLLEEARAASVKAGSECYVFEIDGEEIKNLEMETQMKLFRQFAIILAKRLKLSSLR